jgi:hypothetical protein
MTGVDWIACRFAAVSCALSPQWALKEEVIRVTEVMRVTGDSQIFNNRKNNLLPFRLAAWDD